MYYYVVFALFFSNEGLFETMALTEALKTNYRSYKNQRQSSPPCFTKLPYCSICVSIVNGAFSDNNHVSIHTFFHEQLYSKHTEVSIPVVKHFQQQYHFWYQEDHVRWNPRLLTLEQR